MPGVGLNGFQARTDHAHYLMIAVANQVRQRPSDVFLVIGNQDAHVSKWRSFHAKAPAARKMEDGRWKLGVGSWELGGGQRAEGRGHRSQVTGHRQNR